MPRQTAEDFVGTERFLVQRRLGSGAFGVVYEAYDRRDDALVALKVLRFAEADALYRFKKGFRSLADLRQPNLVALYELLEDDGLWFFTMERVEGEDFLAYLRAGGALDPALLRRLLRQLALGLETLHRHGKLHRDVKPPNVLVTPEGRVVLLDFGLIADREERHDLEGEGPALIGTPVYMSPEQTDGAVATPASDWYSVGVMLYEVLFGQPPFLGSLFELATAKRAGLPRRPATGDLTGDLPGDLVDLCFRLLDPDPRARPTGAEVLVALGADGSVGLDLEAAAEPADAFIGRGDALRVLEEALEASRGGAVAVFVRGPSGMGKTALVRRFLDGVADRGDGSVVLSGRCFLQESVPYKALDTLVDALSRYLSRMPRAQAEAALPTHLSALARLFPVLRRVAAVVEGERRSRAPESPQGLRRRAFGALRQLLARLAEVRPLILWIDDLQWGDADSFSLLEQLLRPPAPPALLFVGTYRLEDEATSSFLRAFGARRGWRAVDARFVDLAPLGPPEARELVRALAPALSASRVGDLVREAEGSPFVLAELVREALRDRRGEAPSGTLGPAGVLREVVGRRLAALPDGPRRLLEVVAVAGKPIDLEAARRAAELSGTAEPLAQLTGERLLRRLAVGERVELETYHDRIREEVVAALGAVRLRDRHRRLAEALEASGDADPETLAVHFRATDEVGRAARYAATAAARAEQALAFERAARLYRSALELLPAGEDRHELWFRLGAALAHAGRSGEAAEAYLAAVGAAGSRDPLEAQRAAAESLLIGGHVDRGMAVLRHVLRNLDLRLESRPWRTLLDLWWRRVLLRWRGFGFKERREEAIAPRRLAAIDVCWTGAIGLCLVDVLHASEFHARHLLAALSAGEPRRVARGLAMEVFFGAMEGVDQSRALALARRLAGQVEGSYVSSLTEMAAGMLACAKGSWEEACRRLERAEDHLREARTGVAWELDTVRCFRALALLQLGRWRQLFGETQRLLESARDRGDLFLEVHLLAWVDARRRLAEDDAEPHRDLDDAMAGWSQEGFQLQHFGHLAATAERALYRGLGGEAWARVASRWGELTHSMAQRIEWVHVLSHDLRGRAALAAAAAAGPGGDRDRLLAVAEGAARRVERARSPWSRALAAALRAGAASVRGETALALAFLETAGAGFEEAAMAIHGRLARRRLAIARADATEAAEADRFLVEQGVREPERMSAVFLPGAWEAARIRVSAS